MRRLTLLYALGAMAAPGWANEDLARLSMEELLRVEVEGASRYAQPLAEAPSAVTVVGAEDIRRFGFRNLAEALQMAPGVYSSYDRAYTYLGIRGFGRPGDYNSRLLLLVDGARRNDTIYDQAMVGAEAPIEMDWIKRLEFVPGPSSAIYGGNALFGIANAVLWTGADLNGSRATMELGSGRLARVGLLSGQRTAEGTDWVAGISAYGRRGEDHYFPELAAPGVSDGWARGLDGERYLKTFVKASHGGWNFSAGFARRRKDVPTAYYDTDVGAPGNFAQDEAAYADIGHGAVLAADLSQAWRFYGGQYRYDADYVYGGAVSRDASRAEWWGGEYRLTFTGLSGHKLLLGAEVHSNGRIDQQYFDVAPRVDWLTDRRSGHSLGVFAQDEWRLAPHWLANLGLRADKLSDFATAASPRLALIHRLLPEATVKLIHGRAFRPPNAYERFYTDGYQTQKPNPALVAERITTTELAADIAATATLRLTGSYYRYRMDKLVDQETDPADKLVVFQNQAPIHAHGVEAGAEASLGGGWRLRGSLAVQRLRQPTGEPVNSPGRLGKLLIDGPLPGLPGTLGLNLQAISSRLSAIGARVPGRLSGNLVLRVGALDRGGEWSLGIYNLADRRYGDPGAIEHPQTMLLQDGRQLRLRWEIGF